MPFDSTPSDRFVVQSPLQVLMATEARRHFGADGSAELVILQPGEPGAVDQIRRVVGATNWPTVIESPERSGSPIAQARFVRSLAKRPVERLYIGDGQRPLMLHLANRHGGTTTVFDDGLGTERLCKLRRSGPSARSSLKTRMAGLDARQPERLRLFSMFDLELAPQDSAIANELSSLRMRAGEVDVDPHRTLLLGGCFVELGVMTRANYVEMIRRSIETLDGNVEYLPHRREPEDGITELLSETDARRSSLEGPIEWSVLEQGTMPGRLVSYVSTAGYTLWRMFGNRVDFSTFRPDPGLADARWLEANDVSGFLARQTGGHLTVAPAP